MREIIMTGKTVEEATELACAELGLSREEVSIEILEMPQKKLFKTVPAKVKATAEGDDIKTAAAPVQPKAPEKEAPKTEQKPVQQAQPVSGENADKAKLAADFLKDICAKMGIKNVDIKPETNGEIIILKADGADVGALIGRRGETMEALSYLCSLVANRAGGDYAKIGLDVGGYRQKREGDLEGLAKKVCEKVLKTNRAQVLEPMNPYERRIIHSAVSEIEGVKSESTGEGAQRRVVVLSTMEGAKNDRPERYDRSGSAPRRDGDRQSFNRDNRGGKGGFNKGAGRGPRKEGSSTPQRTFADRPRTDAAPTAPTRTEAINDGANMPLYGKIEL